MAVSIEQLRNFAQQLGLKFKEVNNESLPSLVIDVPTETPRGIQELTILVKSYDNGEMFEATMVQFLPTELHQESEHKLQFLFYLLHKAWQTKFGTPEVDKDGEVRLLVEIPLVDAQMTLKQFERILKVATKTAVEIAVEGSQILMHGEMPESAGTDGDNRLRQVMVAMIEMVGSADGNVKLKQIADDDEYPEQIRLMARKLLDASSQAPDEL